MTFLQNIRTVARYEAKTLRRSWFFRLFSIGAVFIFTLMNIAMFSPIGGENWANVSIPSTLPLINLYLLNIAQAIVVIFLAADFLKRDKKLDTNEVLYTRSMSNFEYVIGKSWGILRLFLSLNLLILAIGLVINIISKSMSVDIMAYFYYLFIITIPTLIFSLGLAFTLMSLIKNQAITFLLLLGYAAMDVFYLYFRVGSIFDYLAIGLPVFKSGIIGFDNLVVILNQRFIYLFSGLALIMATILLFKRLPQSKLHRILTFVFFFVFLAVSAVSTFNTYSTFRKGVIVKSLTVATNREYENKKFASITDASIDFVHKGNSFEATAVLTISNDNNDPISQYYFSLNPSLTVTRVTSGGRDLNFKRVYHIIEIEAGKLLNPGESESIKFEYSGSINE
jgi:ABC-type transport system involved in multi-copper enzyme maturation permease subunit